uniref:PH domain-containing protein n=1 Tax=Cyprinus carpio TaxID=7962 RepID=A0A8C2FVC5_CYPCA
MEEDIRRKGMLYLHQQRFGKRWRKVWCVLAAESRRSVSRLELYEHKQSSIKQGSTKRKPDYKQVIRLRECIQISEREIADCPKDCVAFYLETSDKLYLFAAQRSEVKGWIKSLCEQAFPVVILEGQRRERDAILVCPTARTNSLFFKRNLRLKSNCPFGPQVANLDSIKGQERGDTLSFSFEAGRRCESGEGNFEFATHQGERLFNIVSAAIQNLPRPSTAKPISPDHVEQSLAQETTAANETYNYTIDSQESDFLPEGKMQKASKMLNPSWRSFSLNAIEPQIESQVSSIDAGPENQEPIYATVSKAQQKAISPTDPQMHWQNLRKALQQSETFRDSFKTDADISQLSDFVIPWEEGAHEETEAAEGSTDLLDDSIQQLAINDALQDISAEAIYAEPQDFQARAEWVVGCVYDEPEEVIKANERAHDGADHLAEHDFFYSPDMGATQAMAALSNPVQSSDEFSTYDNLGLKGRHV